MWVDDATTEMGESSGGERSDTMEEDEYFEMSTDGRIWDLLRLPTDEEAAMFN